MKFYKQIFIFNRPAFIGAAAVVISCLVLLATLELSSLFAIILYITIGGTLYLSIGSLFFSYLIYDLSDLYRYNWLKSYLKKSFTCLNAFSGYSEGGVMLNKAFPENKILHLDFFEEGVSITSSIIKAKELSTAIGSTAIKFDQWNIAEEAELILFMQSLHELRPLQQKAACLQEADRHLKSDGNIIIAEHLCNWKNFMIYGPGAFHFFGNSHWQKAIQLSGLSLEKTFNVTPFIKIYILNKSK